MGLYEWTITRDSSSYVGANIIYSSGSVNTGSIVAIPEAVGPCFYLNSTVKLINGAGTRLNPYRIS